MNNKDVIKILDKLISCKSVTPYDDQCQEYIANFLKDLGFKIEFKKYDDVTNLISYRKACISICRAYGCSAYG